MIIYRVTDRIPVKIGGVTFWVAPLSWRHKSQILSMYKVKAGEELVDPMGIAMMTLKFSLKEVEGVAYADGSSFTLHMTEDDTVSDESLSEVMQLDGIDKLVTVCSQFALKDLSDPKLDGVVVDMSGIKSCKKKSLAQTQVS